MAVAQSGDVGVLFDAYGRHIDRRSGVQEAVARSFMTDSDGDEVTGRSDGVVRPADPTRQMPTLFRGMSLIAEAFASVPGLIWDKRANQSVLSGELHSWFEEPMQGVGWDEWCSIGVGKYHTGQACLIPWPLNGIGEGKLKPGTELRILSRAECKPKRRKNRFGAQSWEDRNRIDGWEIDGLKGVIPVDGVKRVVYFADPFDRWSGISPFESARLAIDVEWMAGEYQRAHLARGGDANAIISKKAESNAGMGILTEPMKPEERKAYLAEWRRTVGSFKNGGGAVFTDEEIDVKSTGRTAKEMEYIALRKHWVSQSAIILNLPPVYLAHFEGIGWGTEAVKEMTVLAWHMNFIPAMNKFARAITNAVVRPYNPDWEFVFDLSQVKALRKDWNDQLDAALKLKQLTVPLDQIETLTELGVDVDLERVPWANEHILPNGMTARQTVELSRLPDVNLDKLQSEVDDEQGAGEAESTEAAPETPAAGELQVDTQTALNGAQIREAAALVMQIVVGTFPRDTVVGMLKIGFNLTQEQAEEFVGSAEHNPDIASDENSRRVAQSMIERRIEETVASWGAYAGKVERRSGPTSAPAAPRPSVPSIMIRSSRIVVPATRKLEIQREYLAERRVIERNLAEKLDERLSDARADVIRQIIRIDRQRRSQRSLTLDARTAIALNGQDAIDIARSIVDEILLEPVGDAVREAYLTGARSVESILVDDLGASADDLFDFQRNRVPELVESYHARRLAERGSKMPDNLRARVGKQLLEGLESGDNLSKMTTRMTRAFDMARTDAERIVITEAQIAMGEGRFELAQAYDRELADEGDPVGEIMWIGGERDSHKANDGQIRAMGETFDNGQRFPGDTRGVDPGEFIRCGCTFTQLTRRQSRARREALIAQREAAMGA